MKPVIKWVENYLKNLPPRSGGRKKGGKSAIDLLDVYGTADTKSAKKQYDSTKIDPQGRPIRGHPDYEARIEAVLQHMREYYARNTTIRGLRAMVKQRGLRKHHSKTGQSI